MILHFLHGCTLKDIDKFLSAHLNINTVKLKMSGHV